MDEKQISSWCTQNNCPYFCCSAVTGEGVENVFRQLVLAIRSVNNPVSIPNETVEIKEEPKQGCCK